MSYRIGRIAPLLAVAAANDDGTVSFLGYYGAYKQP